MIKTSISLLSNKKNLNNIIEEINNTEADYIHLDVMDKKFVKYDSFDKYEIDYIFKNSKKPLDIHLMVEDIEEYIEKYNGKNIEYITIHYEAMENDKILEKIKQKTKVGLSIKPNTNVEEIFHLLKKIDLLLIMSVEPGLPNQKFIDKTYKRIKKINNYIKANNLNLKISVDGGINEKNIKNLIKEGVNILVLGSYLDKVSNKKQTIYNFKKSY